MAALFSCRTIKPMVVPVVFPSYVPERNSTLSASLRGVVNADCQCLRLFISFCINSMSSVIPAGQPSITPPRAAQCDSPNEVSLNIFPKVFKAVFLYYVASLFNLIVPYFSAGTRIRRNRFRHIRIHRNHFRIRTRRLHLRILRNYIHRPWRCSWLRSPLP